ncbi:unnamed protein product, partial [Brassica oleracea var. botrytis]
DEEQQSCKESAEGDNDEQLALTQLALEQLSSLDAREQIDKLSRKI